MSIIVKQEPPLDIPLVPLQETVLPPPASEPIPFCTLCLRECSTTGDLYDCNQENSSDFCSSMREFAGIEFHQQSFNICKTCWKMVQMVDGFRKCCLKGQSWLERFRGGFGCEDDWRSDEMVQTIDYLQMVIEDHGKRFEASEPVEEELDTTVSIEPVKVQPNEADEDVPIDTSVKEVSKCNEEVMEEDSSEDEHLLQEMFTEKCNDDDKETESEKCCNQSDQNQPKKHEKQNGNSQEGILVNVFRQEVRGPIRTTVTAFFDREANIYRCKLCNINYSYKKTLVFHLRSTKHQQKIKEHKLDQGIIENIFKQEFSCNQSDQNQPKKHEKQNGNPQKGILVNVFRQEVRGPIRTTVTAFFDREANIYRCKLCNINYSYKKTLVFHLRSTKHKQKIKEHKLDQGIIENIFKQEIHDSRLNKAIVTIDNATKTYRCEICDANYSWRKYLGDHLETLKHRIKFREILRKSNPKGRIKLPPIRKRARLFKQESTAIHVESAYPDVPYECHFCGEKFSHKHSIKRHLFNQHVNPKQFACTVCRKVFWEARTLEGHMVIHGNQPFKCDKCEKGFYQKGQLDRHKRKKH